MPRPASRPAPTVRRLWLVLWALLLAATALAAPPPGDPLPAEPAWLQVEAVAVARGAQVLAPATHRWEDVATGTTLTPPVSLRTPAGGYLKLRLGRCGNTVALIGDAAIAVAPMRWDPLQERIASQEVILDGGELTIELTVDGREALTVAAGDIRIFGLMGRAKVLHQPKRREVITVVKNGLFEVFAAANPHQRPKVSGFYLLRAVAGLLMQPEEARIIDYDWR